MFKVGDRVVLQAMYPVRGTIIYTMPDSVRVEFDTHVQRDISLNDARLVKLA